MRKIRIMAHTSLDGVIDHGEDYTYGAWTIPYRTPAGLEAVTEAQGTIFDLLMGRRTYDLWASFWPNAGNIPVANGINAATKYVATHKSDALHWGPATALGADILEGVREIKSSPGPDLIVWGSASLSSLLIGQGLVDEVVLLVYPVLLGEGKRFFSDQVAAHELAFVSSKVTPTGVLINTYKCLGNLKT
jgi:dihydrofolate reductase